MESNVKKKNKQKGARETMNSLTQKKQTTKGGMIADMNEIINEKEVLRGQNEKQNKMAKSRTTKGSLIGMKKLKIEDFIKDEVMEEEPKNEVTIPETDITFNNIAGYSREKECLMEIKTLTERGDELDSMGIRLPKGILLAGEPGVGKTLMATALIHEANIHCEKLSLKNGNGNNMGELIEQCYARAENNAPSIVFIDEIDKIAGLHMFNRFSVDMERLLDLMGRSGNNVMTLATCNDESMLSESLRRSGRFDRIISIGIPNYEDRLAIIKYYASNKKISDSVDFNLFAKSVAGMTGADIECIMNEAGINAIVENRELIEQKDFDYVINRKIFKSVEQNCPDDEELRKTAIHEAGHVISSYVLNSGEITGLSIVPQGNSRGHAVISHDVIPYKVDEIEKLIIIALSGKTAESVMFPNEKFLGSEDDVHRAYSLAEKLVYNGIYGFEYFVDVNSNISEYKLQKTEGKICDILNGLNEISKTVIMQNRAILSVIVDNLMDKKTLSKQEITDILKSGDAQIIGNYKVLRHAS